MDHADHLAHHDAQLQHLVALNVTMVEAIDGMNTRLAIVTELLQRAREDEHRNGG